MNNKKKKVIYAGCIMIQMLFCILCVLNYANMKQENEKMLELITKCNETQDKIFYGEWEIVELLCSENVYWERAEYMIGKVIEYTPEAIFVDQERVIENPCYAYGIIPTEDFYELAYGRYPEDINEVIPENNSYYVCVSVATAWEERLSASIYGTFKKFYIYDRDKMILDAGNGYYVMERRGDNPNEGLQEYYW